MPIACVTRLCAPSRPRRTRHAPRVAAARAMSDRECETLWRAAAKRGATTKRPTRTPLAPQNGGGHEGGEAPLVEPAARETGHDASCMREGRRPSRALPDLQQGKLWPLPGGPRVAAARQATAKPRTMASSLRGDMCLVPQCRPPRPSGHNPEHGRAMPSLTTACRALGHPLAALGGHNPRHGQGHPATSDRPGPTRASRRPAGWSQPRAWPAIPALVTAHRRRPPGPGACACAPRGSGRQQAPASVLPDPPKTDTPAAITCQVVSPRNADSPPRAIARAWCRSPRISAEELGCGPNPRVGEQATCQ
jgi:hypothetical protein